MKEIKLSEEIKANPEAFMGKCFLAECRFRARGEHLTLQLPMRILRVSVTAESGDFYCTIEPANKNSVAAETLKRYWFGSSDPGSFDETFEVDDVFGDSYNRFIYCRFLEWTQTNELRWLSKNFGLHDPDVLLELERILPKYKDELFESKWKVTFDCVLRSGHKISVATAFLEDMGCYIVAFGRTEDFDLNSCVGSGQYTFE